MVMLLFCHLLKHRRSDAGVLAKQRHKAGSRLIAYRFGDSLDCEIAIIVNVHDARPGNVHTFFIEKRPEIALVSLVKYV